MPQGVAIKSTQGTVNPLERLAGLLSTDLDNVNELILARLHGDIPLIGEVASYLIAAGGKRIRPLLTLGSARLWGDTGARPYKLASSVEFIHTASLLHDDVVDESAKRRGRESANIVFGNKTTVLVGDFLFSRAFQMMVEDGSLEVLHILSAASAILAQGEVMQLQLANNMDVTLDQYKGVIGAKTAALFAAACEIGPVIAGADKDAQEAMRSYGYHLGMAFQIADDILDYGADRVKLGKAIGDDFREGKLTAPVLFALRDADGAERAFWSRVMGKRNQKGGDFERALTLLNKRNAFDECYKLCESYAEQARQALCAAPDTDLRAILIALVDHAIRRDR